MTTDLSALAAHYAFATPIIPFPLANAAQLNADLTAAIRQRQEADPKGVRSSNTGGWHSDRHLVDWAGEAGQTILNRAYDIANAMTVPRSGQSGSIDYVATAWANVSGRNDGHHPHTHPEAFWSGTYYVDDGRVDGEPVSGIITFEDPRNPYVNQIAPDMTMRGANTKPIPNTVTVAPVSGLMLMFPSWLRHSVSPYLGSRERISVAFNLYPKQRLDKLGASATQKTL